MVFSNLIFLYLFLPACLIAYFCVSGIKAKNIVLVIFSLFFYAWGEPVYVLLMAGSAALNYGAGLWMGRVGDDAKKRRLTLIAAVTADLVILAVFKYAGLLVSTFNSLTGLSIPVPQIALPIGISFFTFQAMTYVIDVYRSQVKVQGSYLKFLLYITMFPQLIAGPIVRYSDIEAQMEERSSTREDLFYGLVRFATGLGKKILIADHAYEVCSKLLDGSLSANTVVGTWLGVLMFTFQIYFDFSGYSDMAIGLGRMFGFHFLENLTYPFICKSVGEFWKRWHISLGSWFTDYLYIPLGGSRVKLPRLVFNMMVVWTLTGLWHGAAWTYFLWGMGFGVFLVIERLTGLGKWMGQRPIGHLYAMFVVVTITVMIRSDNLHVARVFYGTMFGLNGAKLWDPLTGAFLREYGPFLAAGVLLSLPVPEYLRDKLHVNADLMRVVGSVGLLALTFIAVTYIAVGSYNPFIYFNF